jgi:hypothetical protein
MDLALLKVMFSDVDDEPTINKLDIHMIETTFN